MKKYFKVLVAILAIAGTTNGLLGMEEQYLSDTYVGYDGFFPPLDQVIQIDNGYVHRENSWMLARHPRLTIRTVTVDKDGIYHGTFKEFDLKDKYPRTPYISTINDQGTLAKMYAKLQSMYEAQEAQLAQPHNKSRN